MFYIDFDGEVDTQDMITQAHKLGKIIAVPVCRAKREMDPCLLREKSKLVRGLYGISEPAIKKPLEPQDLNLVVVPGVAFDKQGRRLGRGKGYYDRFLGKIPSHVNTLGLAFDFQVLPAIPVTKRDIRVQKLLFA